MNLKLVLSVTGQIIKVLGYIMLSPILVILIYNEPNGNMINFLIPAALCLLLGNYLSKSGYDPEDMHAVEGFMVVALSWLIMSLVGSLPFMLSGELPSFPDAFFETASGFSTTGATVFTDVEVVSNSILFWRSLTQWLGGMGVLVFVLAITPSGKSESIYIMKAEVPGSTFGKLRSRVSSSAQVLYRLYVTMTVITIILLVLARIPLFDSILLSFGAAATGGFTTVNAGIAHYDNTYVELILAFSMLAFGVNFNLYYMLINRQFKSFFRNEELKWYISIILIFSLLIALDLFLNDYRFLQALHDAFFSVTSMMTTTAYVLVDFTVWPIFPRIVLLLLMFVGGMSGSTAGGLKVSRVAIIIKVAVAEIRRVTYPNRVVSVHFEEQAQDQKFIRSVINYFVVYVLFFILGLSIVSLEVPEFISAFSLVAAMINNVGTGFGSVGPAYSYSVFSGPMKIFLSLIMIAGRLEIYPMLILLSPGTWKRSLRSR